MKKVELDPIEDSGAVFEEWPSGKDFWMHFASQGKVMWVRFGVTAVCVIAFVLGLVSGVVILVNKILEQ